MRTLTHMPTRTRTYTYILILSVKCTYTLTLTYTHIHTHALTQTLTNTLIFNIFNNMCNYCERNYVLIGLIWSNLRVKMRQYLFFKMKSNKTILQSNFY